MKDLVGALITDEGGELETVACPHCGSSLIRRIYTTTDYAEIVGIDSSGMLVEGEQSFGDPNREGLECCECWVPLLPHEIKIKKGGK